ncbi:Glucan endo-1,3-beta-glucosidase, basic isoform-like protein [Drosera capensis]
MTRITLLGLVLLSVSLGATAISSFAIAAADIGTCYGLLGDNLPSFSQVVALYNRANIQKMRIYAPVQELAQALQGSNIEVMVGVPNEDLDVLAASQDSADAWIQINLLAYPNVNWRYIAVGNEIRPNKDGSEISQYVLPAMQNIQNSLNQLGLSQVKVSTAWDMAVFASTYPPSQGTFDPAIESYSLPIVNFLVSNGSPLLLNCYPYFVFKDTPSLDINYALFTSPGVVVQDGPYGYQNLLFAMVDAAYSALEKAGATEVPIVLSETGWPTEGDVATSVSNAQTYNNNLIQKVSQGTPKRPGQAIETYIFDMFDENLKSPELEKHWGLFTHDGTPKYSISL